jgi:hypothetical protein
MVSVDTFKKYKEALSGLTDDNIAQVTSKLVQLGLGNPESNQSVPPPNWGGPPTRSGPGAPGPPANQSQALSGE